MTAIGRNLSIVIECECKPMDNWLTFASWYSVTKTLPEAEVVIACKRALTEKQYFIWCRRIKDKFFMYNENYQWAPKDKKVIIIKPTVMAVREYEEKEMGPVKVQSQELTTFVDFSEGCGKFVVSEWINKDTGPFRDAMKTFSLPGMTANELRVLALWQQSFGLYVTLEGGYK